MIKCKECVQCNEFGMSNNGNFYLSSYPYTLFTEILCRDSAVSVRDKSHAHIRIWTPDFFLSGAATQICPRRPLLRCLDHTRAHARARGRAVLIE